MLSCDVLGLYPQDASGAETEDELEFEEYVDASAEEVPTANLFPRYFRFL